MKRMIACGALFLFACAHSDVASRDLTPLVKQRASFELGCPEAQLNLVQLGADQDQSNMAGASVAKNYGVSGCGRRASYRAWCVKAMMMKESCDATQTSAPVTEPASTATQ